MSLNELVLRTWKDVERKIKLHLRENGMPFKMDFDVYVNELVVMVDQENREEKVKNFLKDIFGRNYVVFENRIYFDEIHDFLEVDIEITEEEKKERDVIPLFRNVIYKGISYDKNIINSRSLDECPVVAFHSYKGGVGRTLSMLTFVKAWSCRKPKEKLLIVDADIEAPGVTLFLQDEDIIQGISYLDLLEEIQNDRIKKDDIVDDIVKLIKKTTISIDTGEIIVQHMVLPTYRYEEQYLDIYVDPASIVRGYGNRYALAEYLSMIGKKVGAAMVLVDLRAGMSEASAPLIFDPRVKKYIVTSTSFQAVQGTKRLLKYICKGLPISAEGILPELLLTMVPKGLNTNMIKSELLQEYNVAESNSSYTDNVITELPFASELIHLSSLPQIMENLEDRDFYKKIDDYVLNRYMEQNVNGDEIVDREIIVRKIYQLAQAQITAEGNKDFSVLLTQPISNLVRKFSDNVPQGVVLGAKGAGKTFLCKEMIRKGTWENFIRSFEPDKETAVTTYVLPLVVSGYMDVDDFIKKINEAVVLFSENVSFAGKNRSFWKDNANMLANIMFGAKTLAWQEWKDVWLKCILNAFHDGVDLEQLDEELQREKQRVLFVVDGLEELFQHTFENENEKNAIYALVREVISDFKIKYKNIGLLVFLRKDLASDSIVINYEQFENQYRSFALNWSHEEALRLALWLVSQAAPEFCADIDLQNASKDIVEKKLNRLWGVKLGKNSSNEAYSSRWILAALSDFNSQLQARDIIRFLKNATEVLGKTVYKDRYIMPTEIKKAVQECSKAKIKEIKQEIVALKPILEELENALPEKKVLPFKSETFGWSVNQEKILRQEGLLKIDNDKYYLPEIIRHALKFKYEKGARPKVLSLLLKN